MIIIKLYVKDFSSSHINFNISERQETATTGVLPPFRLAVFFFTTDVHVKREGTASIE